MKRNVLREEPLEPGRMNPVESLLVSHQDRSREEER